MKNMMIERQPARRTWVAPRVVRLATAAAENGDTPISPDGQISFGS